MAKMFTSKNDLTGDNQPQTIIGQAIRLDGKCIGSGDIIVHGEIVGTVKSANDIVIEQTAKVEADVEANNLTVAGEIHGNVLCHSQLKLLATGKIFGDVTTDILSVETGAVIKGQCATGSDSTTTKSTPTDKVGKD